MRLSGWLEYKRGNKFFTIRDNTGSCQILCESGPELPAKESVLSVEGVVQLRPDKDINPKMGTGAIEVNSTSVTTLNECTQLPFPSRDSPKEEVRMRYRYVDLRSKQMQHNLRLRSSFLLDLRKYLCEEHGFIDVETPTLFRRTPGGAKEFLVPTQTPGQFYCLPQSPQQFKQLLMAGAIDRYMQVAKCYRDEGAKPERQPEFTQLDLEMSFTNQEEVKHLVEEMIEKCWPKELPRPCFPFPRLSYLEAITNYGTDKPDTRFNSQIIDITEDFPVISPFKTDLSDNIPHVKALNIKKGCLSLKSKKIKEIERLVQLQHSVSMAVVKLDENNKWISPITKYLPEINIQSIVNERLDANHNDLLFICANNSWKTACETLGTARQLAAHYCAENGYPLYDNDQKFNFLWVENFPLFEEEDSVLQSSHHPFTAPLDEDKQLLYSDPLKVRGQHYDLVLNGSEIGGGSIRIHNSSMQRYVLENILHEDTSQLEHLLQALDSGCPPHGGIALGLDRLLAIMCNAPSIRDVIAFPKSSKGADLMTGAPCNVSENELSDYHISVVHKGTDNS